METKQEAELTDDSSDERGRGASVLVGIIRISALLCLAGWTWVHLYWEGPYGVLLWHDAMYELAHRLGISWDEFVGTGANDGWIQNWIGRIGWLYLAFTIAALIASRKAFTPRALLIVASGMLLVLSYAKYLNSQNQLPMLVEHGGQVLAPLLLVFALTFGPRHRVTVVTALVAFVTTFAGHGCYAIGWWPTPGNFYGMISLTLGVEYETATAVLHVAGILDFAACLLIFVPWLRPMAAVYGIVWGSLTAVARPVAGMSLSLNYWGADQFLHEAVLRAPHFLIPLYLLVLWQQNRNAARAVAIDS